MKKNQNKSKKGTRLEILESALASFKIEGVEIPRGTAMAILKKIELRLEKSRV